MKINTNHLKILINKGNLKALDNNLKLQKVNLNSLNKDGLSIFHWSIVVGNVSIIKFLINNGSDFKVKTRENLSPMELAIYSDKLSSLKTLIPYYKKKDVKYLFHTAASLNRTSILRFLSGLDLDVNTKDYSGRTALHWAAQENSLASAKLLMRNFAKVDLVDHETFTPLAISVSEGYLNFTKLLVQSGANVNKRTVGGTALHLASVWGHFDIVKYLVKVGAKYNLLNDEGNKPDKLALDNGHIDIVSFLIK